jgi:hypothetical protein
MAGVYNPWASPTDENNVPGGLLSPMLMDMPADQEMQPEHSAESGAMHAEIIKVIQSQSMVINQLLEMLAAKE